MDTRTSGILCILGFPGTGKSVLLKKACRDFHLRSWHLGTFVREKRALTARELALSEEGQLLEGEDDSFLEAIQNTPETWKLLDGFPRSIQQLNLLQELGRSGHRVAVACLSIPPGRERAFSLNRQRDRALHQGLTGDALERELFRIEKKISRALDNDLPVIERAKLEIPDFLELDSLRGTRHAYRALSPWLENILGIARREKENDA